MVQKVKRIDVVFNIYQETSIKAAERFHRESKTNIHLKNTAASHKNTIVQLHQQYSSNAWLKNGKKEITEISPLKKFSIPLVNSSVSSEPKMIVLK